MLYGYAPCDLEVRRAAGTITIVGQFNYGSTATLSAGGKGRRPLKERIHSEAFSFAVQDPEREINLLFGHSWDKPLASKLGGSLALRDTKEALHFEARIADEVANTSHGKDALALLGAGLATGVSPAFRVPDIPNAETVEQENPASGKALIRTVRQAVLYELSIVTRGAYPDAQAQIDQRSWELTQSVARIPNDKRNSRLRWRL
ncbi:MAG: hypothetical protein Hals2KO_02300 [Halioglobus sp.]